MMRRYCCIMGVWPDRSEVFVMGGELSFCINDWLQAAAALKKAPMGCRRIIVGCDHKHQGACAVDGVPVIGFANQWGEVDTAT